jgi:hypothetical protein
MNEDDLVAREQLGESLGGVAVADCAVAFRRQLGTNDVWCVITGPRGTLGHRLIENESLRRVREMRPLRDATRDESSRRRVAGWSRVRIEDDFSIAVRGSGRQLRFVFLFGDGASFGGGSSGLPSLRRDGLFERVRTTLSGRRSDVHTFHRR